MDPGPAVEPLRATLRSLWPAGISCVALESTPQTTGLYPEETLAAARFSAARLEEFALGRRCARQALQELGMAPTGIGVGPQREPLWPMGIVGSISHATGIAVAAVAHAGEFASLGIDIEAGRALDPGLAGMVCLPGELEQAVRAGLDEPLAALLAFSAKEAAYKALWPLLRRFLDFHDLEILHSPDRCAFQARPRTPSCPEALAASMHGRTAVLDGMVAAIAWIRAPAPGSGRPFG